QVIEHWRQAKEQFPRLPESRHHLAGAHFNLSMLLEADPTERDRAAALVREGIDLLEELRADDPKNPGLMQLLASCYGCLAKALRRKGDLAGAEIEYRRAIALQEQIVASFPTNLAFAVALAGSYGNLSGFLREHGKPEAAVETLTKSIELLR